MINLAVKSLSLALLIFGSLSCVSTKKYVTLETNLKNEIRIAQAKADECNTLLEATAGRLAKTQTSLQQANLENQNLSNTIQLKSEQFQSLKEQIEDMKMQRDKQLTQVSDLTVLSQSASNNIKETLSQLESRDKYIRYLHSAKSMTDSINLALAINLKSVLREGIDDKDIEIKVDKTVVFINISDKMLYESGSSTLTPRANEVLSKIAQIVSSRPQLEVMVEGYTDNDPINTGCLVDNWDLSVKRSTSVVRALQTSFGIDPNRMIAAGRGEYNTLASNDTMEGKAINRRTRIILLPKLNQFYDLLNPKNMSK